MLVEESGPLDIFSRLRLAVGIRYDQYSEKYVERDSWFNTLFGELLSCIYCTSVWVSIATIALYLPFPGVALIVSLPFCISSVVILIDRLVSDG